MRGKSSEAKLLAAIIAVAGLILVAYSLLATLNVSSGHDGMMGIGSATSSSYYGLANMLLAILGTFMLAASALYLILRVDYEPMVYPLALAPVAQGSGSHGMAITPSATSNPSNIAQDNPIAKEKSTILGETEAPKPPSTLNEQNYLILRLLTGDERTIFRAIMDAGGEALQRDLVAGTKMSEAKVSRVIDRLVEKGVVSKERDGMGNRIRIQIDT